MKSTKNYDQFKSITSNRELDELHVKRLMASIEKNNLLELNPIIVNENMEIIDGQHRLEAARRLNVPVFYNTGDVSEEDISTLNSVSKRWSAMDYINYYTIKKRPGFDKLSHFISEHPHLNVSTILRLIAGEFETTKLKLEAGQVDVRNYDRALEIAKAATKLYNTFDFANDRGFICALKVCWFHPDFDFEHFQRKLNDGLSRRFVKCRRQREYLEMIQEIYNYNMMSKNHIKLV